MAENDNESSSNQKITWASLIPDFFYDLIGRVIPGCLFIIGLVYTLDKEIIFKLLENIQITINGSEIVINPDPPFTFIFIVLLGAGYASALILSVIGDLLCNIFKTSQFKYFLKEFNLCDYIKELVSFPTELNNTSLGELKRKDCEILFQIQHDYVKKKYRPQARSLSKSQAEVQLCLNTSAAFLILFLIQIFRLAYLIKIGSLVIGKEFWQIMGSLALLLAIISISFLTSVYRNERFLTLAAFFVLFLILIIILVIGKDFWQTMKLLALPLVFLAIASISLFAAKYRNKRFLLRQFSFCAEIKKREENA